VAAGVALALLLNVLVPVATRVTGLFFPRFPAPVLVSLPAGAMLGDIVASFLKRRTGRERGAAAPGLDQLDFVVGALVLTVLAAPGWAAETFSLPVLVAIVVLTPLLHVGANAAAYALGLKAEPW
jgi:CDP-2,3-bis-(O-geranylgeranyl)-sn-glycerol synthase